MALKGKHPIRLKIIINKKVRGSNIPHPIPRIYITTQFDKATEKIFQKNFREENKKGNTHTNSTT